MKHPHCAVLVCTALAAIPATPALAATWSDTFLAYRYSSAYTEPMNPRDIEKHILSLTHVSGYSLGQNFFNLDILQSDRHDPSNGSKNNGATEFYATYRHQLSLGKTLDKDVSFGPVKDVAITAGFDLNTKNTAFAPRKRLLVVGPTFKFDVPKGFVDLSLLYGKEWNHCGLGSPACPDSKISFDPQFMASLTWNLPFDAGAVPLKFQGFANYNGPKGKDYAGISTKSEVLVRTSLMADVGKLAFDKKNTLWVGIGYEYWHNKFGNRYMANGNVKPGIKTSAPTVQVEWHF
ncbi:MAG TPA: outer membrane protein OmpK [Alcaligenes sp.]|nr:outer membrane protein OmpK [Alcaligenes sp.]HRL27244.1 outer membrane protein OmpK [Alcaligenes sp.]